VGAAGVAADGGLRAVSYCWGLRVGYTTRTIPQIAYRITKEELRKGDVMLYEADHVVYFGGWTDSSRTSYLALQEPGCHTVGPHYAFASTVPVSRARALCATRSDAIV
jgi:hypothetical protein